VIEAPTADCPKCGQPNAFKAIRTMYGTEIGGEPRYHEQTSIRERPGKSYDDTYSHEWLAWPCRRCGYEMETEVLS